MEKLRLRCTHPTIFKGEEILSDFIFVRPTFTPLNMWKTRLQNALTEHASDWSVGA